MSEDTTRNAMTPNPPVIHHDTFEHEDLTANGPLYFMAGLAVTVIVIFLIVFGMYRFLDSYTKTHQPALSPMATPEADTRIVTHGDVQSFPEPRLEENERTELRSYSEEEERKLATYDWVDKSKGIVRIPIDRAMELIVQRGLPVHAAASGAQKSAPVKEQAPKAPATKAAASGN
jgi:hypothetical protein